MPTYELAVILRQMTRVSVNIQGVKILIWKWHWNDVKWIQPEIVSTLKRTAETIFDKGGIIRKLENLGTRPLPYKMSEHGLVHRTGSYFMLHFDCSPNLIADFSEEYGRDIDIVRANIFKVENPKKFKCTLDEELLPPAYRKEVIKMIEVAKRRDKPKYDQKSGLDYYPFQK